jgi:hypothetical protein
MIQIGGPSSVEDTSILLRHLCWDSKEAQPILLEALYSALFNIDADYAGPILSITKNVLLDTQDHLRKKRIFSYCDKLLSLLDEKKKYPKKMRACIWFLQDLIHVCDLVSEWAKKNNPKLEWLQRWILEHRDFMQRSNSNSNNNNSDNNSKP